MGPRRQLDVGPLFAMQTIAGLQRGDLSAGRRVAARWDARLIEQWLEGDRRGE